MNAVTELGRVHLVGIGGAGMSAVAGLLAARGVAVSGSDAKDGPALAALRAAGVEVHVGHDAAHVADAQTLVVSSAVRPDNVELAAAQARGIRVLHRSQALAALMVDRRTVAVAGAHGKTTTSAMVAVALLEAGLDPSYAIGGTVLTDAGPAEGVGGARHGNGDVLVAEADESDGSFLNYRPTIAVVTNVEPDHLDHYGTREAFEEAFGRFAGQVQPGGHLVACADDDGALRLAASARSGGVHVVTYGTSADADVRLSDVHPTAVGGVRGLLHGLSEGGPVELVLTVPGLHNALNATAAWVVARVLGVSGASAARGLGAFRGTGRRFEHRGQAHGVRVVDDYAHHPIEVAALLRAARPVAGGGRVRVLFQPHLYSRTKTFADEFATALALADDVVVTEVYAAREDPDPAVSGAMIVERLVAAGRPARFVADREAAARALGAAARPGDLLLTVGAGDVTELAPQVLAAVRPASGSP